MVSRQTVTRREVLGGLIAGAAGLTLAACGSPKVVVKKRLPSSFPLGAAAKAKVKPVDVVFWNSMTDVNHEALKYLTDQFNSSQSDVRVTLVDQNSYPDTLTAYQAALSGGPLPQVVQMETDDLQLLIDSQSVVPIQDAIDASHMSTADFLPEALDYFRVEGKIWAMPFAVSSQILYYNKKALTSAGLDPSSPPQTIEELKSTAKTLTEKKIVIDDKSLTYGMALPLDSSTFEEWLSMGGVPLVNHGNGRSGRATKVEFDNSLGKELFEWYATMFDNKWAQPTPGEGSGAYDNLLSIGAGKSAMTISTSATLGTVVSLLAHYPNVSLGIGPLPGPNGTKGVFIGGSGLYIVKLRATPEQQDGAWQYIQHLSTPASQAYWAAKTGYVPVRKSSLEQSILKNRWTKYPEFKVAYDQILASPVTEASSGAVLGPASTVSTDIVDALTQVSEGHSPLSALAQAATRANAAIASYNARIGG